MVANPPSQKKSHPKCTLRRHFIRFSQRVPEVKKEEFGSDSDSGLEKKTPATPVCKMEPVVKSYATGSAARVKEAEEDPEALRKTLEEFQNDQFAALDFKHPRRHPLLKLVGTESKRACILSSIQPANPLTLAGALRRSGRAGAQASRFCSSGVFLSAFEEGECDERWGMDG